MKRQIEEVTSAINPLSNDDQDMNEGLVKRVKVNPVIASIDQLSEECFELILVFMGVLAKTAKSEKKATGEEEEEEEEELKLSKEMEEKPILINCLIDWKELKNISLVSKSWFSRCFPLMVEHEVKQVKNQVFDNTSEFYRPVEASLEILNLKQESEKLKLDKIQQWDKWFNGELTHINKVSQITSQESQKELREKVLKRASYSFKNTNEQMLGRWEISSYCHLLEDLHLSHCFESSYEESSFSISIIGDLAQVNHSIRDDVMKYLTLPLFTSFKSEESDEDYYDEDEEDDKKKYKSITLMNSEYITSNVFLNVLNHVRNKLGISSQVTNEELVAALVFVLPFDITKKTSEIHYEEIKFEEEEEKINFTIDRKSKIKERSYASQRKKELCCTPCQGYSIFNIGPDALFNVFGFLRLRYVATLSETCKNFYNMYTKSGWSFPIRMLKIIDSMSPFLNKESIKKSLSEVRDARNTAFSEHPPFVKYLKIRYSNIDYLSCVETVMKLGNHIFKFKSFDDEGSSPYFTIDDITNGEVVKLYAKENDFYCSRGHLVVRKDIVHTLETIFEDFPAGDMELIEKFLDLLPWDRSVNWLFVTDIKIGNEPPIKSNR